MTLVDTCSCGAPLSMLSKNHVCETLALSMALAYSEEARRIRPFNPRATLLERVRNLRATLAGWGESQFATAASGDDGERLLNILIGVLADVEEAFSVPSPSGE